MSNKKHSKKPIKRALNSKALAKRTLKSRRPLHKKFLLHPITIFGLLVLGVFLFGLTLRSFALSISVTATVPAKPLSQPAVITSPEGNTVVNSTPITVVGTCPASSYVTLTRNGLFSGVDICTGGAFNITTSLFPGLNQLQAQDYNFTDKPGPVSEPVDVTYNPPSGSAIPHGKAPSLPILDSAFQYQVFYIGQTFSWTIDISGGLPPYTAQIAWGDGSQSTVNIGNTSSFVLSHVYFLTGNQIITITATDARDGSSQLQLAAIIKNRSSLNGVISSNSLISPGNPINGIQQWLWLVWPVYITVLLMALSFWLGEYQENYNLKQHKQASRRS